MAAGLTNGKTIASNKMKVSQKGNFEPSDRN